MESELKQRTLNVLLEVEHSSLWCGNYSCPVCEMNEPNHTVCCDLKKLIDELKK